MTDYTAIKALQLKKQSKLTSLEIQQLSDLQKVYGINNIVSAIRFSKTALPRDVASMLLQHCGFREKLPPSVRGIILDKTAAQKRYTSENIIAAGRLETATYPIKYEIEKLLKTLLSLWKSKVGGTATPSIAVEYAIKSAITKFGFQFSKIGLDIIPANPGKSEEQLIILFKEWLDFVSTKNWIGAKEVLNQLGNQSEIFDLKIPQPISSRLEKYFIAKANRRPSQQEVAALWSMLTIYKYDELFHAMSCVPSNGFSLNKVEDVLKILMHPEDQQLDSDEAEDEDEGDSDNDEEDGNIYNANPLSDDEVYDYSTFDENGLDSDEMYLD